MDFGRRTVIVTFAVASICAITLMLAFWDVRVPVADQSIVVSIQDGGFTEVSAGGRDDWPAVTADGRVAWQAQDGQQPSALDKTRLFVGPLGAVKDTGREGYGVIWSPSGKRYVYATWAAGAMHLHREDGTTLATDGLQAPFTIAPMVALAHQKIAWLDEERVVYVALDGEKRQTLRQIDAGGAISTLTVAGEGKVIQDVVAAPGGSLIYVVRDRTGRVRVELPDGLYIESPGPLAVLGWRNGGLTNAVVSPVGSPLGLVTATWSATAQPSTVTVEEWTSTEAGYPWPPVSNAYRQTARLCPDGVWMTRLESDRMELVRVTAAGVSVMATAPPESTFGPVACAGPHRLATLQSLRKVE